MDDGFVLPHRVGLERAAGLVDNQEPPSSSGDPLLQPTSSRSRLDLQQLPVLKPIIRRLYIDEGLTFVQVANILKKEYKFNITKRQFSSLLNKWGWRKNTRQIDRQKILDKLKDDEKSIPVEGRVGTLSLSVEKLNRWKKELENKPASAPTHATSASDDQQYDGRRTVSRVNRRTQLVPQPSSPKELQVSEYLASNFKIYVTGMFDQGVWDLSDIRPGGNLPNGGPSKAYILDDFLGSTNATMNLILKGSYVEARRVFTTACNLVRNIFEEQDVLLLSYIIGAFSVFRSRRNEPIFEVLNLLRSFIARMAITILPQGHPLAAIFYLFGYMDLDEFDEALLFSMDMLAGLMAEKLGVLHRHSLTVRRSYISFRQDVALKKGLSLDQTAHGTETDLRKLLRDCGSQSPQNGTSSGHFVVLRALASVLRLQGRPSEAETVSVEIVSRAIAEGDQLEEIGGLGSLALSQYEQGKNSLAEINQRRSADINLQRNDTDSLVWAIAHLTRLEEWLREWGRFADADELQGEISVLINRNNNSREEELVEM